MRIFKISYTWISHFALKSSIAVFNPRKSIRIYVYLLSKTGPAKNQFINFQSLIEDNVQIGLVSQTSGGGVGGPGEAPIKYIGSSLSLMHDGLPKIGPLVGLLTLYARGNVPPPPVPLVNPPLSQTHVNFMILGIWCWLSERGHPGRAHFHHAAAQLAGPSAPQVVHEWSAAECKLLG